MMPCNPPNIPHIPTLVGVLSLAKRGFGSLGGFNHDSLHTRKGGVSHPYKPLYILPSSQITKKVCECKVLRVGILGNRLGCWEVC